MTYLKLSYPYLRGGWNWIDSNCDLGYQVHGLKPKSGISLARKGAVKTSSVTIHELPTFVHWLLFIHEILISSTCFEPQVLVFTRIQLYTCSIWYCHSLWEFLVACRYTAWVRTDRRGKVVGRASYDDLPTTFSPARSWLWIKIDVIARSDNKSSQ